MIGEAAIRPQLSLCEGEPQVAAGREEVITISGAT
jgi:hypothetical protein